MRRLEWTLCILALVAPRAAAQQGAWEGDDERAEYEAYFGKQMASDVDGPSSLQQAKKEGRGYRIGQGGIHASEAPTMAAAGVHVVREGDTLWDITGYYLSDPWRWPEVWSWNPEITNPHWIYPLDTVRVAPGAEVPGDGSDAPPPTMAANTKRIGAASPQVGAKRAVRGVPGSIYLREQGYLEDSQLQSAGQILNAHEDHMFLTHGDEVYVTVGSDEKPAPGDRYTVFRRLPREDRETSAKGELVRIYGTVEVRSFDAEKQVARGLIVEALDPIERGFGVARMERRFEIVAPEPNDKNVTAHIIASVRPVNLLADGDVVFLDVGKDSGARAGNRFFVVRRGDQWTQSLERPPEEMGNSVAVPEQDEEKLPKEVVAEIRVVKVQDQTTVGLVTRSDVELVTGDVAEMRVGF